MHSSWQRPAPSSVPPPPQAAFIREVTELHILQVTSVTDSEDDSESDDESQHTYSRSSQLKRRGTPVNPQNFPKPNQRPSRSFQSHKVDASKFTPSAQPLWITDTSLEKPSKPPAQYRYQYTAEDQRLVEELLAWLLDGKLTHATPAHVLAASPSI